MGTFLHGAACEEGYDRPILYGVTNLFGSRSGMSREKIQSAFQLSASVPSMSESVRKFIELLDAGQLVSPQTLQAVAGDPGLSAVLIRAASTAKFAQSKPVSDARTALQLLGSKGARSAAQSTLLSSASAFIHRRSKLDPSRFVTHSLMVSILARYLYDMSKSRLGFSSQLGAEEVSTAGTLHELPWAGFCALFPAEFDELYVMAASNQRTLAQQFEIRYQYVHKDFVALIFESWKLPAEILDLAVAAGQDEFTAGRPEAEYCLQLANLLAEKNRFNLVPLNSREEALEPLCGALGLEEGDIEEAVKVAAAWTNASVATRAA